MSEPKCTDTDAIYRKLVAGVNEVLYGEGRQDIDIMFEDIYSYYSEGAIDSLQWGHIKFLLDDYI